MSHKASCSCGQLTLAYEGEIKRTSICHCFACQKRTGSVFGVQTRLPEGEVTVSGKSTVYVRIGDEGSRISFHFCPTCGATVYYFNDQLPGSICVPLGGFADNTLPAPVMAVYDVRRHPWFVTPDSVKERYD